MKTQLVLTLFALVGLSGCGFGGLSLVGFDKDGNPVEAFVDEKKYSGHVTEMLELTQSSVLPGLEQQSAAERWKLRSAVVGFGVKGEVGFGPFRVGVKPRFRVAFARGENPPLP